ncbi:MAG: hypothetical protein MI746_06935 [Pseudomonadales bacterium]|nr:hypothetical protein [Pseudomonadales bacterium]
MSIKNQLRVLAILSFFIAPIGSAEAQISGSTPNADPPFQAFVTDEIPESEGLQARDRLPGERGCGAGSLSWSANDFDEVPGIHWAFLRTYCRRGVEIVIWTDFESSFFGGSERAKSNGRMVVDGDSFQGGNGNHRIISGMLEANARITYEFEVIDEREGFGFINDFEFDLENGGLFLVASDGRDIDIKQIHYNTAGISAEDLKLLAIQHAEIRAFFEDYHQ